MSVRDLKRRLPGVLAAIQFEMRGYGKGVATEGYAGGYMDAIYDIEAVLRGQRPSDKWGFWRRAQGAPDNAVG